MSGLWGNFQYRGAAPRPNMFQQYPPLGLPDSSAPNASAFLPQRPPYNPTYGAMVPQMNQLLLGGVLFPQGPISGPTPYSLMNRMQGNVTPFPNIAAGPAAAYNFMMATQLAAARVFDAFRSPPAAPLVQNVQASQNAQPPSSAAALVGTEEVQEAASPPPKKAKEMTQELSKKLRKESSAEEELDEEEEVTRVQAEESAPAASSGRKEAPCNDAVFAYFWYWKIVSGEMMEYYTGLSKSKCLTKRDSFPDCWPEELKYDAKLQKIAVDLLADRQPLEEVEKKLIDLGAKSIDAVYQVWCNVYKKRIWTSSEIDILKPLVEKNKLDNEREGIRRKNWREISAQMHRHFPVTPKQCKTAYETHVLQYQKKRSRNRKA